VADIGARVGGDHLAVVVGADQHIARTGSHIRPVLHAPGLIPIKEVLDEGFGIDALAVDAVVLPVRATKAVADVVPGPAIAIEPQIIVGVFLGISFEPQILDQLEDKLTMLRRAFANEGQQSR
jgi:hypothetical protein